MISTAEKRANPFQLPERVAGYFKTEWQGPRPPAKFCSWRGTPPTLVLMGPNGAGKTRFAAALFRRAVSEGEKAKKLGLRDKAFHPRTNPHPLFWRAGELVAALQEEFAEEFRTVRRRAEDTALLVLDELGSEKDKVTDYYIDELSGILSFRWDRSRPTIITTNWSHQEWHKYSPRLASRFLGNEGLHLSMKSRDRRQGTA